MTDSELKELKKINKQLSDMEYRMSMIEDTTSEIRRYLYRRRFRFPSTESVMRFTVIIGSLATVAGMVKYLVN